MRRALAALPLALLAACGGSDGDPLTVEQLADRIGCEGFAANPDVVMVREAGSCQLGGEEVYLYTFSDREQRDAAPTEMGGGIVVEGDLWQVQVFDQGTAEQVAEDAGGDVRA